MTIALQTILPISNLREYKAHLACWNGSHQPLDVFVRDRTEWEVWNKWRSSKDDFNRRYIFSLIDFYPEPDIWLFGGIFEGLSRGSEIKAPSYNVHLTQTGTELIGRLKVCLRRPGRTKSVRLENYYSQITVCEILKEPYSGERFCGYDNINHDFTALETVFRASRPDWKAALESVKGVYLIIAKYNGKKYVGSAYGDSGIWARWACYVGTGHGWNDVLTKLISDQGIEYARKNFRFSLLEYRPARTDDRLIIERENYWKEALLSRGQFGYNRN
jgi:hypothetical protein